MESKEFLEKFTEQFIDCDDISIDLNSNFRDIDSFDSLVVNEKLFTCRSLHVQLYCTTTILASLL